VSKSGSRALTREEFIEAYTALSKAAQVKLLRAAEILAFKTNMSGDDLLQEAVVRAIDGERNCPAGMPLTTFLYGAMRSIADAERKSLAREGAKVGLEVLAEVGAEPASPGRNAEEAMIAADDFSARVTALLDLFADDEPALMVVMGDLDEIPAEELRQMVGLDKTGFATVRKRIRRKLADAYPNGWKA
jgi:DNA-directed RNA polymerase specialized sigma24 family protein